MSRTAYYNGIGFDTLGLIINKTVVPTCSASKRQTISIPDGPVIIEDTKVREPIKITIECTLTEPNKLRDIYAMLQDEGVLILPDEQDKYYYGILSVSTPKNIILYYNRLTFTMTAEPYAYAVNNAEEIYPLSDMSWYKYTVVTNNGTAPAEPVYRITAVNDVTSFDLWIEHNGVRQAGCRFEIEGGQTYIIDIRNHIAYDSQGHIVLDKTQDDFTKLTLPPGESSVCVSQVNLLKIKKNERWY